MKRWCLSLVLVCLLSACGSQTSNEELALDVCTTYEEVQSMQGEATVVSDYGQRVYEYALCFSYEIEEGFEVEIMKPDHLSGIKAIIDEDTSYLEFEEARLETGDMVQENISPMSCIPDMLDYLQNGYISEYASEIIGETDCLRLRFSDPSKSMGTGQEALLWIAKDTGNFVKSEILFDGVGMIYCEFTHFEKTP